MKTINFLVLFITAALIASLAILPSCEKNDISVFSEVSETSPSSPISFLQWEELNTRLSEVPNRFFILSESLLNSDGNPGYRIQGNYINETGYPVGDAIQIGNLTFPINDNGQISSIVSETKDADEFSQFKDLINVETSLYVMSEGTIIDEIKTRIPPPLKAYTAIHEPI